MDGSQPNGFNFSLTMMEMQEAGENVPVTAQMVAAGALHAVVKGTPATRCSVSSLA